MKSIQIILFLLLCFLFIVVKSEKVESQIQKFAVIGDYGTNNKCGTNESAVANLVNSWNAAFIITTGDNIYYGNLNTTEQVCPSECVNDFDSTVKKYYGNFYTANVNTNNFFPAIGDHDISGELDFDPRPGTYLLYYLDFFRLPGNERYYTFLKGNIRFICLNNDFGGKSTWTGNGYYSDTTVWEPHGIDSSSTQGLWCKNILDTSTAKWNIVYQHKPVYFSWIEGYEDIYKRVRWPLKRWGADIVISGDLHWYERVRHKNLTFIANGLGGGKYNPLFDDTTTNFSIFEGSQILYNDTLGAQLVEEYTDSLVFKFVNAGNEIIDRYVLLQPKTLRIKICIEGLSETSNSMISDTVRMLLCKSTYPYTVVDTAVSVVDTVGNGLYTFQNANYDSSYFLSTWHRNSIETWTSDSFSFDDELQYDFTTYSTKAFGDNLVLVNGVWCLYSGDVNQDQFIDVTDLALVSEDAGNLVTGYVATDVNGDDIVDATDVSIVDNNSYYFVQSITPLLVVRP